MTYSISKFDIGKITVSFFAKLALQRAGQKASNFLNLHKQCNYGEITLEEKHNNDQVVRNKNKNNKQILSSYTTSFNETIWIVSRFENDKSTTTVLLPHEYDSTFHQF